MPIPYPKTALELIQGVLSRLNQDYDSTTANLDPGNGGVATITTPNQVLLYLNEAQSEMARRAYQVDDNGTYTTPTSTLIVPFSLLTMAFGHTIFGPRTVLWNGNALDHVSRSELELWFSTTYPSDNGTPLYWSEEGSNGIIIYPTPSTSQTTKVYGLCYPRQLVNYQTAITGATNATPIVVTTSSAHYLGTGMTVYVNGVLGNTAANGYWTVTVLSATTFSLTGSVGNSAYTSGGTIADVPTWFEPDREKLLEFYAAVQYARKNAGNDQTLGPLIPVWEQTWEDGLAQLQRIMSGQDPQLTAYNFGVPSPQAQTGN